MDLSAWAVVIPSNRRVDADNLRAIPDDVLILVVEDGETPLTVERRNVLVLSKPFQRRFMGSDYDLIPRGTAACRNFGFYYLWRETSCRYLVTIDDDVVPRGGFLEAYAVLGDERAIDTVHGPAWLNPVDLFDRAPACFARGFPFEHRCRGRAAWSGTNGRVAVHMGLWDGVLDTHAIDKTLFPEYRSEYPNLTLSRSIVRLANGGGIGRFPLSSMNFGFVRDALPAMYQIPMRPAFVDRYALWRYDDIWAGYIAQTLAACRGDAFTLGAPIVAHRKAGDLQRELQGEHYGILMSPYFYEVIDLAARGLRPAGYLEMYGDLIDRVLTSEKRWRTEGRVPAPYAAFILDLARTLGRWAELCARCGSG